MPYVEASVRSRQFVAAARRAMARGGVAGASLRAVAAEAGVPLGTLQYVFPSKELLLKAVIEDVVEEAADLLAEAVETDRGLAHAIRQGFEAFWSRLVVDRIDTQIMQSELLNYMLRTPGHADLARWQYRRYTDIVAQGCREAAAAAGEVCAVPYDRLARLVLSSIDGLTLQYACDPDEARSREDLETAVEMVLAVARIRPAGAE
ncbi:MULTISPECIES: TetR/AcrR family transcriptional regulator [unclassified Nocardiopsis]|uniref:TetR/AcrR family transcriptional regulator n=1 Tax=Nocardiopsis TaxID=2013 RepID=UPI00387AC3E9